MTYRWAACICLCFCVLIIGAIVCPILFLAVFPYQHMKFHVIDASLTEFYLTGDDILHYNLTVNISIRNSNKIERISYRIIRFNLSGYGKDLASVSLPSFLQGTKNTTLVHPVFQGQTSLILRGSHFKDFIHDRKEGSFSIDVDLYLITQLKYAGGGKGDKISFTVGCGLFRLNLLGSSSSLSNQTGIGGLFKTKRCKVHTDRIYNLRIFFYFLISFIFITLFSSCISKLLQS
ncbi:NDR1/HIN1-like protein 10 [Papaver somniferum]|uniref:NDR1/HIN1-like protein 10 n=1 Tax=Papaver somniferum TaxID=3469 RepID=UPI000E7060F5|nr:NDR1/HIN1-like protein 10 [Papaver somniferum]